MIKSLFVKKDTTLYNDVTTLNTGLDELVELRSTYATVSPNSILEAISSEKSISRILMKFDISEVSKSIASGEITSPKFYLKLFTSTAHALELDYSINAYPVSGSWQMGSGRKHITPYISDGATWDYKFSGSNWVSGGGDYYNTSASLNFSYETTDVEMNVTNIVNLWISQSIPNEGFIIKFPESLEADSNDYGSVNFFSRDTHTIYPPLLQVKWDDSVYISGSLEKLDINQMALTLSNLKPKYKRDEVSKITVFARDKWIPKTFVTSSRYIQPKRLPETTYYCVKDAHTEDILIPYDSASTKISCDGSTNYFLFDMSGLQPERYYKFVIKTQQSGSTVILDDKFYFKVER